MNDEIKALTKKFHDQYAVFQKQMKTAFEKCCNHFFEKYPNLQSFSIVGYTPYFNDGDTCEYSIKPYWDWGLQVNGFSQDDLDSKSTEVVDGYTYDEYQKIADELEGLFQSIDDDFFKQTFGDHSRIIFTRNGIKVESYDHD